ncbi:Non-specific serine/threonine protein kinase protein [Dioscorea alata]|uniref:Non-specific serine/threonine protein kinase protein n=1 Tax=Dioscorea alata TaxID=55571 RepID=A0ACB7VTT5_DIOAL|nr:Non-specific serine/threonine protein kinase protein [Dioscorea alata]
MTLINWEPDNEYIQTGMNKNVTQTYTNITMQMKSLRYFPQNTNTPNCYSFITDEIEKYIVRASFYYGNYDGLMKPPTFNVSVNGFKWMTVVTSSSQDKPIVIEAIFSSGHDSMQVCVESSKDGDVPFISSLEVVQLPFITYGMIDLGSAFLLQQRATFGRREDVVYTRDFTGDMYNRIWKAEGFPNYNNISTSPQFIDIYVDNEPPNTVVANAIEASSLFDPIILSFNPSQTNQSLCAILYFIEVSNSRQMDDSREFQIDIGRTKNAWTVNLQPGISVVATLYHEWVDGPVNITMKAVQGSSLPPLINAMEVYTTMKMHSLPSPPPSYASLIEMAIWIALFLLMIFNQAYSQSEYGFLNVDCGEEGGYIDDKNITWSADYGYAKQGYKQTIDKSSKENYPMNTLRVFPYMNKNCYILPAFIQQKYLLRAGFFYGNYDGLSRPPIFDLQFDANSWTTVFTSNDQPVFYEAVIIAKWHNINVCLQRTRRDDVPFISSLQIMQLLPGMYTNMKNDHALFKEYRLNFGSDQIVRFFSYPDDKYGRIWEAAPKNNYKDLTADFQTLLSTVNDDPPNAAMRTAIQSKSPSDPILLSFNLKEFARPLYIALYFTEVSKLKPRQNRTFDIYISGQDFNLKLSPVYQKCNEVHGYVVPTPGMSKIILSLVASENSNMPPILNAMELFSVSETVSNGTAPQDVFGLGLITQFSSRLSQWNGDPCLPVPFDWIACNQDNPSRITAL